MENIIYTCLCINPNFHYINHTLLINLLKTIHKYSSLKILICRFLHIHIIPFSYQHHNKILCTDNLIEQL